MRNLYLFLSFLLLSHLTNAQLTVKIKGGNHRICEGMSLTLTDSIVSGTPISYTWSSTIATFTNSSSKTTSALFSTSGNVVLKTEDGTNTFFDTVYITVDTLPFVGLKNDLEVCCDYGNISLNFSLVGSADGTWSCSSKPAWITNNQFYVDSACGFTASNTYAKYTLQDTNTGCFNSDSLRITVRPLPNIIVKEGDFCQDINEINLKKQFVISPVIFIGTPSWKCISCNGNDFSKMLIDKGSSGITDYRLDVSKATYTFKNAQKDTIKLEFEYTDAYGCKNRDTVIFRLWRVPEITFSSYRDLCWEEGKISLNTLYGVNITGGRWEVYDTIGFRLPNQLGQLINGDTINTLLSNPLANENATPNKWFLRYIHTSSGCPSLKDTVLRIFPSPKITLTNFNRSPPMYCENERPIPLEATPSGGVWSSSVFNAVVNDSLQPKNVSLYNKQIQLFYNYTSPTTGCRSKDSVQAIIQPLPTITGWSDTSFGVKDNQTIFDYPIPIILKHYDGFYSTITNPSSTKNADLNFNKINDTIINLRLDQLVFDSCDMFRILLAAGGIGACHDIEKTMELVLCWKDAASLNNVNLKNDVLVYPNPTNRTLHFTSKIPGTIRIYDTTGKLIHELNFINESSLDLINAGVYTIHFTVSNTKQTWIKRVIVTN